MGQKQTNMRNPTSDLQIPCLNALPLSHKDKKINLFQKSLTCNFSLQNPHIIQKTGNKNTQTNQVKVSTLIELQILITNLQGNV